MYWTYQGYQAMGAVFIAEWIVTSLFFSTVQGATSSFQQQALDTINSVEHKLQIENCINSAKQKANSINEKYGDRHYAALWISMYSRECYINEDLLTQNKDQNAFPFRLNKELRCLRNSNRDPDLADIFVKVRNTINDALDVFGMNTHATLYRGMETWNYDGQMYFVEEGYFSTSMDATPALRFAKGQVFLIVQNMNGLKIRKFVQDKFSYQKEVLGKSGKMFEIQRKVTDKKEINQTITALDVDWSKLPDVSCPETIIYVRETTGTDKQSVLNQQWLNMDGYCSVGDNASAASEIHDKATIVVLTVICLFQIYG